VTLRRRHAGIALAALCLLPCGAASADSPQREVHGASDTYAEPGLALAWSVLRGQEERETKVVIRIEADPARHAWVSITGRDPFDGSSTALLPRTALAGFGGLGIPRSRFADYPRTELRFFAEGQQTPHLLVYFLGVPDTTPEFTNVAALVADVAARLARARAAGR
jgi:hypothetical protein